MYTKVGNIKDILIPKIFSLIHKDISYQRGKDYAFSEIELLAKNKFLESYTSIDVKNHSLKLNLEEDQRNIEIRGFYLKTSELRETDNHGKQLVTSNDTYMLKCYFPNIKVPIKDHLYIEVDRLDIFGKSELFGLVKLFGCTIAIFLCCIIGVGIITGNENIAVIVLAIIAITFLFFGIYFFAIKFITQSNKTVKQQELENIEFEKMFNVYSQDPIESRVIITPAFQDSLVQFIKRTKMKYDFYFTQDTLYLKGQVPSILRLVSLSDYYSINRYILQYVQLYLYLKETVEFMYEMNFFYLSKTTQKD